MNITSISFECMLCPLSFVDYNKLSMLKCGNDDVNMAIALRRQNIAKTYNCTIPASNLRIRRATINVYKGWKPRYRPRYPPESYCVWFYECENIAFETRVNLCIIPSIIVHECSQNFANPSDHLRNHAKNLMLCMYPFEIYRFDVVTYLPKN